MANFFVYSVTYVNGFPYHHVSVLPNIDDAMEVYERLKKAFAKDYPLYVGNVSVSRKFVQDLNFVRACSFEEDSNKGDGYFLGIISDDNMTKAIMEKIDLSLGREWVKYIGGDNIIKQIEANKIELEHSISHPENDSPSGEGKIYEIVRRPYDWEDEECEDYVYDVYMTFSDMHYTNSLECISVENLCEIFTELFF